MASAPVCEACRRHLINRARFYDHVDKPGRGKLTGRARPGERERVCDRCGETWWEPVQKKG